MDRSLKILFALSILGNASPAGAQLLTSGIIHDSRSLAPLDNVVVLVVEDETSVPLPPSAFSEPTQQGQITGPDGQYALRITADVGPIRILLERPSSRFVFPSVISAPRAGEGFGGLGCVDIECPLGAISGQATPTAGQPYALRFNTDAVNAANNHLPADTLDNLIPVSFGLDRTRAEVGEWVNATVEVANLGTESRTDLTFVATIPGELRFSDEQFRVVRTSAEGVVEEFAFPNLARDDLQLRVALPAIGNLERIEVRFGARVVRTDRTKTVQVRGFVEQPGGVVVGREQLVSLEIAPDLTLGQSTILGQVYCERDGGRPGFPDGSDEGLFGARIYLDTGFHVDSDPYGRFHFTGVPPGTRLLKLDAASLPPGSESITPARVQLYLSPGTPAKVRFGVRCAEQQLVEPRLVDVKTPTRAPAPASRDLEVGFVTRGTSAGTLRLGEREDRFITAHLSFTYREGVYRLLPRVQGPYAISRWAIELERLDANGVVQEQVQDPKMVGSGLVPLFVDRVGLADGRWRARLSVRSGEEDFATSAWVRLLRPPPKKSRIEIRQDASAVATLREPLDAQEVEDAVKRLQQLDGEIVVVGYWDGSEGAEVAEKKGLALAERVQAELRKQLPKSVSVHARSRGATRPVAPDFSARLRIKNRRVELYVVKPEAAPASASIPPPPANVTPELRLEIDGKTANLDLSTDDQPEFTAELDVPAKVAMTWVRSNGAQSTMRRSVAHDWINRPGSRIAVVPRFDEQRSVLDLGPVELEITTARADLQRVRANARRELVVDLSAQGAVRAWSVSAFDILSGSLLGNFSGRLQMPAEVAFSPTSTAVRSVEILFSADLEDDQRVEQRTVVALSHSAADLQVEGGALLPPLGVALVDGERSMEVSGRVVGLVGGLVVSLPDIEPLEAAKAPSAEPELPPLDQIKAADLQVALPKPGVHLEGRSLAIAGRTRPDNEVEINGQRVFVSATGRFAHQVSLAAGRNRVQISSRDQEGNRVVFERGVETSSNTFFLMALGEAELTTGGAALAGSNQDTHVDVGGAGLDGRLMVFTKAQINGAGPFKKLEFTGRVDTAEQVDSTVRRLADDPLRMLPAVGDASNERQDAVSRHKIYLDVQADASRIRLGNGTTELGTFDRDSLFSAQRSGFGVHAQLERSFGEDDKTEVSGVATFANGRLQRAHDELLGTGGALYWLSRDEVIEGSAKVRLVVRDRDTGMVLHSRLMRPGQDYELRPREGRLTFREPVSGAAGNTFLSANRTVAAVGHPVFIVVDYEYLASGTDDSAFGVQLKETLFDQVELSLGYAGENRVGGQHRVFGAGFAYRPTKRSFFEFEFARSSGATSLGRLSLDGGLQFLSMDRAVVEGGLADTAFKGPLGVLGENALALQGRVDFEDLSKGTVKGFARLYGRSTGLKFSSLSAARDQGRVTGGIATGVDVGGGFSLRGAVDSGYSIAPELLVPTGSLSPLDAPAIFRVQAGLGIDYRDEKNRAGIDFAHLHTALAPGRGQSSATGLGARYSRQLTERLRGTIAQDVLVRTDAFMDDDLGRLATTLILDWQLHDAVELSLGELIRWNGDNATQLGVKVRTADGVAVYVRERFGRTAEVPLLLTTIVGTEDSSLPGTRAYAELQMDGFGASPEQTRAVLGTDSRWRPADGLEFQLAYERAQLTRGTPILNTENPSPFTGLFGGLTATLGGFGDVVRFLPGAVSRDAAAVGVKYVGLPWLKLSQRLEMRIDQQEESGVGSNYRVLGAHSGLTLQGSRDLTAAGRLTFQHVQDTTADLRYAQAIEGSLSAVYRPSANDWFTLIVRYTKRLMQRPTSANLARVRDNRDAFSAEPIFDTPLGVQLAERVALVNIRQSSDGTPARSALQLLWINRLNATPVDFIEGGVEYRMLQDFGSDTLSRGFLIEAAYLPDPRVRVGVGYNFTDFSDDVLALENRTANGPFFRVTGRY